MTEPVLQLRDIEKHFQMGETRLRALAGVDVDIRPGEFVAIMGPSGSGKTTLLEILGTLSRPTHGTYRFAGDSIEEWSDDELADLRARRLGFVFQTFNLLPRLNAVRNAALPLLYAGVGRKEREERARAMLGELGLAERLDHHPGQMSGGERQRVAIARALVNDPEVVLADEPTGNLDARTGAEILDILARLQAEGRTIVVVTHSDDVAAIAERVIYIRDGRIEHARAA